LDYNEASKRYDILILKRSFSDQFIVDKSLEKVATKGDAEPAEEKNNGRDNGSGSGNGNGAPNNVGTPAPAPASTGGPGAGRGAVPPKGTKPDKTKGNKGKGVKRGAEVPPGGNDPKQAKKDEDKQFRDVAVLRTEMTSALSEATNLVATISTDPTWEYANNQVFLKKIQDKRKAVETIKGSSQFMKAWTLEGKNFATIARARFDASVIKIEMNRMSEVRTLVQDLQKATRAIVAAHTTMMDVYK